MKTNYAVLLRPLPTRAEGERISGDGFPVVAAEAVGLVAWVLPNVAVIDQHGLNDWIVAHTPVATEAERRAGRAVELAQQFAFLDHDRDGRLVLDDVRTFLAALRPELREQALERAAQAEMKARDHDGDGAISRDEYVTVADADVVRHHAHERWPPPGYVEGFRPNVSFANRVVTVAPREPAMTADEIRAHQQRYREKLGLR